jgi:hypothetical protein
MSTWRELADAGRPLGRSISLFLGEFLFSFSSRDSCCYASQQLQRHLQPAIGATCVPHRQPDGRQVKSENSNESACKKKNGSNRVLTKVAKRRGAHKGSKKKNSSNWVLTKVAAPPPTSNYESTQQNVQHTI